MTPLELRNAKVRQALDARERKKEERKREKRLARIAKGSCKTGKTGRAMAPTKLDRPKYRKGMRAAFYKTQEWRVLRWHVLAASEGRCSMCNRGRGAGAILHVDHIKPRSRFPELELDAANLQVLCEDCNLGKGARTFKCH